MADEVAIQIDIPCDVQQVDETDCPWAFLGEARVPSLITEGAIVVSGDEIDPVLARIVSFTAHADRTLVHLEVLPGDPHEYVEALGRPHFLAA